MGILLTASLIAGGGLWYSIQVAPYNEVVKRETIEAFGEVIEVDNYRAIDSPNSPTKFRACFEVPDWGFNPDEEYKDVATPLVAPGWFDCFDAEQIQNDISTGEAVVLLAGAHNPFGTTTYIAHYPDGRAFMWRQLNECGEAYFSSDPVPADCPTPDGAVKQADVMIDPSQEIFKIRLTPFTGDGAEAILLNSQPVASFTSDGKNYQSCFETASSLALLTETYMVAEDAIPTEPIGALPCYDAKILASDIASGEAVAFMGEKNIVDGYDRLVAIYADGKGYAWHQRAE